MVTYYRTAIKYRTTIKICYSPKRMKLLHPADFPNEYIIIKIDADIEAGFICVQSKPPKNPDNTINWDLVKRIKLMFIGTEK